MDKLDALIEQVDRGAGPDRLDALIAATDRLDGRMTDQPADHRSDQEKAARVLEPSFNGQSIGVTLGDMGISTDSLPVLDPQYERNLPDNLYAEAMWGPFFGSADPSTLISEAVPKLPKPSMVLPEQRGFMAKVAESWRRGDHEVLSGVAAFDAIYLGKGDTQRAIRTRQQIKAQGVLDPIDGSFMADLVYGAANIGGQMVREMWESVPEAAAGAGLGAVSGAIATGPAAPVGMVAGGLAGAGTGLTVGMVDYMFRYAAGSMAADMIAEGENPAVAKWTALVGAIPYTAIEFYELKALTPQIKRELAAVTQKSVAALVKRAAKVYAGRWTQETYEEVAQEAITIGVEDMTAVLNKHGVAVEEGYLRDRANRLWETFKQSGKAMALIPLPTAAIEVGAGVAGRPGRAVEPRPAYAPPYAAEQSDADLVRTANTRYAELDTARHGEWTPDIDPKTGFPKATKGKRDKSKMRFLSPLEKVEYEFLEANKNNPEALRRGWRPQIRSIMDIAAAASKGLPEENIPIVGESEAQNAEAVGKQTETRGAGEGVQAGQPALSGIRVGNIEQFGAPAPEGKVGAAPLSYSDLMVLEEARPGATVEEGNLVQNINSGIMRLRTKQDATGRRLSNAEIRTVVKSVFAAKEKLRAMRQGVEKAEGAAGVPAEGETVVAGRTEAAAKRPQAEGDVYTRAAFDKWWSGMDKGYRDAYLKTTEDQADEYLGQEDEEYQDILDRIGELEEADVHGNKAEIDRLQGVLDQKKARMILVLEKSQAAHAVKGELAPSMADGYKAGVYAKSIFEGGEVKPGDGAWRSMGQSEFNRLLAGEALGGPEKAGKRGGWFSWFPELAAMQKGKKGKPKYLVEFGGFTTEGEAITQAVRLGDVSGIWKNEGGDAWVKMPIPEQASLKAARVAEEDEALAELEGAQEGARVEEEVVPQGEGLSAEEIEALDFLEGLEPRETPAKAKPATTRAAKEVRRTQQLLRELLLLTPRQKMDTIRHLIRRAIQQWPEYRDAVSQPTPLQQLFEGHGRIYFEKDARGEVRGALGNSPNRAALRRMITFKKEEAKISWDEIISEFASQNIEAEEVGKAVSMSGPDDVLAAMNQYLHEKKKKHGLVVYVVERLRADPGFAMMADLYDASLTDDIRAFEKKLVKIAADYRVMPSEVVAGLKLKTQVQLKEEAKAAKAEIGRIAKEVAKIVREAVGEQKEKGQEAKTAALTKLRQEKNEALEVLTQQFRALREQERARVSLRDYRRKLKARLQRPVPKTIDFEYGERIEVLMAGFNSLPAGQRSVAQMEEVLATRLALEDMGREVLKEKKAARKAQVAGIVGRILGGIRERFGPPSEKIVTGPYFDTAGQRVRHVFAWSLNIQRIFDWLDGAQGRFDPKGAAYGIYHQTTKLTQHEEAGKAAVEAQFRQVCEENGVTVGDFFHEYDLDGEILTGQQLMGITAAAMNQDSLATVVWGNKVKPSKIRKAEALLPAKLKVIREYIMAHYDDRFPQLRQVYIQTTNQDLPRVRRYSPIRHIDKHGVPEEETMEAALKGIALRRHTGIPRQFTYAREDIPAEWRRPMDLNFVNVFHREVDKSEHYIVMADWLKTVRMIFQDREFRHGIEESFGKGFLAEIDSWFDRVLNPAVVYGSAQGQGVLTQISKLARRHRTVAALAINAASMLKQAVGGILYAAEAGPKHFLGACLRMVSEPGTMFEEAYDRDPLLRQSSPERETEELREELARLGAERQWTKSYIALLHQTLAGLRWVDMFTRVIGQDAMFNRGKELGMSDQEAGIYAHEATGRVQEMWHPKDLAGMYSTSNELLNWFLQFTKGLNQVWGISTYDIPAFVRSQQYGRAVGSAVAVGTVSLLIWAIENKRLPEDDDDLVDLAAEQLFSMIPLVGNSLAAAWNGYDAENLPLVRPGLAVMRVAHAKDKDAAVRRALEEIAGLAVGFPVVAERRLVRFAETGDPWEVLGRPPRKSKKGKKKTNFAVPK